MRHIRILRKVGIVARTKCNCAQSARVTGILGDRQAMQEVYDLLDLRKIPRIRKGVRRVRVPETPSQLFEGFVPRQERRRVLAKMFAELREIADPYLICDEETIAVMFKWIKSVRLSNS